MFVLNIGRKSTDSVTNKVFVFATSSTDNVWLSCRKIAFQLMTLQKSDWRYTVIEHFLLKLAFWNQVCCGFKDNIIYKKISSYVAHLHFLHNRYNIFINKRNVSHLYQDLLLEVQSNLTNIFFFFPSDWDCHFKTVLFFLFQPFLLELCFGSLSCWRTCDPWLKPSFLTLDGHFTLKSLDNSLISWFLWYSQGLQYQMQQSSPTALWVLHHALLLFFSL